MPTPVTSHLAMSARDPRLGAWRAFLTAHVRLERLLDEELRLEHDLSLAEYDALVQLTEVPGRRLRMHQLADRVLLSRSGITRLVDRLVADGLVERVACTSDGRGAEAVITHAGIAKLREASSTHLRGVEGHFLDSIDPADLAVVERAMDSVSDGIDAARGLEVRRAG
jgi:DNA-binding MarR family transcriptional regulator